MIRMTADLLLGRNGSGQRVACWVMGAWVTQPGPGLAAHLLLFSNFSVVLAFVHLYTMFMIVPIFNSMMRIDRSSSRAAKRRRRQRLADAVERGGAARAPASSSVHLRVTLVMGDFVTIGDGRPTDRLHRQDHPGADPVPAVPAAANAVILLAVVLMITAVTRLVDIRREL